MDYAAINENVQNPRHHYHHRLGGGRRAVLFLVQPSSMNSDNSVGPQQEMDVRVQRLVGNASANVSMIWFKPVHFAALVIRETTTARSAP